MDYSRFVYAVQNNDKEELATLTSVISAVLIKFLKVRLGATHQDAEDSAQNTLMLVFEKIKEDKLNSPDSIIYYLFTTAKHDYLKVQAKIKEPTFDEAPDSHSEEGDQLSSLLNEERMTILKACLNSLKPDLKSYISYWFHNPGDETSVVADHFGISVSNAWTKKHRILKMLKECCEKKLAF
ncbi:MAG: sigma-70 family RNA polymerase sigma factor [Balneolaceae bacterium]